MGLMAVVSLPRPFVFRLDARDPHPTPWIRVKLSAALGHALYPQPAWEQLADLWELYYPPRSLDPELHDTLAMLERTIPALVTLLIHHRPAVLRGKSLPEVLDLEELWPARLRGHLQHWRSEPQEMYRARPILAFAAVGQGRADGKITPEEESTVLGKLLTHWALTSTLEAAAGCADLPPRDYKSQRDVKHDEPISTTTRRTPWPIQKKPARAVFAGL